MSPRTKYIMGLMSCDKIVGIGLTIHEQNIVAVLVIKLSLNRIKTLKHNSLLF